MFLFQTTAVAPGVTKITALQAEIRGNDKKIAGTKDLDLKDALQNFNKTLERQVSTLTDLNAHKYSGDRLAIALATQKELETNIAACRDYVTQLSLPKGKQDDSAINSLVDKITSSTETIEKLDARMSAAKDAPSAFTTAPAATVNPVVATKPTAQTNAFLASADQEKLVLGALGKLQNLVDKTSGAWKTDGSGAAVSAAGKAIDELVKQGLLSNEHKEQMMGEIRKGYYANAIAILEFGRDGDLAIKICSAYLDNKKLVGKYKEGNYLAAIHTSRASAYEAKEDYANAIKDFEAARVLRVSYKEDEKAKQFQDKVDACGKKLTQRAQNEYDSGNYAKAIEILDSYLGHVANVYIIAYELRGKARMANKEYDAAIADFKSVGGWEEKIKECEKLKADAAAKPTPVQKPGKAEDSKALKDAKAAQSLDDRNLASALSEIRSFVAGKAKPGDKKRLVATLEKVYGIADYFSKRNYYLFESKNDIADFKAKLESNGIKEKLTDNDISGIKGLKEGEASWVALGNRLLRVRLVEGKLIAKERLGLEEVIKRGRYADALEPIEDACRQWFAKDKPGALAIEKAEYYYDAKKYGIAADYATQAIKMDLKNASAYNLLGNICYDAPDATYDSSIAAYTKAINLAPDEYVYYSNRGNAYDAKKEYGNAIADYKMAKEKGADADEMDKNIAKTEQKLNPAAAVKPATQAAAKSVAPTVATKGTATGTSMAALVRSAKFMPVEVDDVWTDTKSAYDRNNPEVTPPDGVYELTRKIANSQFSEIIDYSLANGWITAGQKDALMKGELPNSFGSELALLKAMLRVSTQRGGMTHVNESFDAYRDKSAREVLLVLPQIAKDMQDYDDGWNAIAGKTIGKAAAAWWTREFGAILAKENVDIDALRVEIEAAKNKKVDVPKEVAGELNAYTDIEIFKQDWRVVAAATAIGSSVDYEQFKNITTNAYDVGMAIAAAKAAVDGTEQKADPAKNAACDGIEGMVGTVNPMQNGSIKLSGGITREGALALAVEAKVLYSGSSREDVKKAAKRNKDNVSGEIFKVGETFYALSHQYADMMKIADPNVKKEGRKIANAPMDNPLVKEILRQKIQDNLVVLGIADDSGNRLVDFPTDATNNAISDYLGKKAGLTQDVRLQLAGIALASRQVAVAKKMGTVEALIAEEPSVVTAIATKCASEPDKNAAALALVRYLNDNADKLALKDEAGNFSKDSVLNAIQEPAQPAAKEANMDKYGAMNKEAKIKEIVAIIDGNDMTAAWLAVYSDKKPRSGEEVDKRLAYLASLPKEDIFEDDGSKMSVAKIVAAIGKYDKTNPGQTSVQTAQQEYDALDIVANPRGKIKAINDFLGSSSDADVQKAQEMIVGDRAAPDKMAERLAHLADLPSDRIFENGTMSAANIVSEITAYETALAGGSANASWDASALQASMPELHGFIAANKEKINGELLKSRLNDVPIDQATADAIMKEFVAWASQEADPIAKSILNGINDVPDLVKKAIENYQIVNRL